MLVYANSTVVTLLYQQFYTASKKTRIHRVDTSFFRYTGSTSNDSHSLDAAVVEIILNQEYDPLREQSEAMRRAENP